MVLKVAAPHSTDYIDCGRVKLFQGEVHAMQRADCGSWEAVACFINGEGWRFYVMNDDGTTIDAWTGTEKDGAPAG